ncbi:MAG: DUF2281 domain-containing protein [Methanoregula sp.]|jgi:hypothetical protein|uniref:DUF2281 domain-containing protein n=1 Tax=Methanoregula sp. TaxID=2052170 RepID=UPI0025CC85C4|nr:DUF2281 domain-containing protein [Methanoregula sp.]MCK9632149.1 DUF2281 domain-containing protein [Methanoregula sp.]
MSSSCESVEEKIRRLPPDLRNNVLDYIDNLTRQAEQRATGKFRFEWEGCLAHLKTKYTSVDLQHKALDWWT